MTEPLPRNDVIDLLNRLGSDQDEDVLKAAREVHARITAAGASWEDLLVPEESEDEAEDSDDDSDAIDDDIDDDSGEDEAPDSDDEPTEPAGAGGAKHADSLALIDELLALRGISSDLRDELKGYKTDIAAGEFESRDRRYLGAIHKRLSKRR